MGKYLDIIRNVSNSTDSGNIDVLEDLSPMSGNLEKTRREGGYELNELNELSPICIFCRQPVERGIAGTGALAGQDLHIACYEKSNGQAVHKGACPHVDEAARVDAEERAAIQEEDKHRNVASCDGEDPLQEFDEWIRG